jgi:carbohydrate ABC transporter ATP-binding protein, CUT1 family (TC 3.A.1.1.-)
LTVEDGEFVALLGPSGCGKTTTMLMIAGIYKPDGGEILFDDVPVTGLEPKDRNIGMVFQNYALYPHMTVLENIAFPLKQQKVKKAERERRAREAAKMVKMEPYLNRKPGELSGGQQQRVALARALVKRPRLLLLDEPLSNLDARLKIEMRTEILQLQKKVGITSILVTHDQEEAMTLADRIAVMKDGKIVQYDTPMGLYHNPKNHFVAQFIGNPPMNFLHGALVDSHLRLAGESFKIHSPYLDNRIKGPVIVGIRPHDLRPGTEGEIRLKGTVRLVETVGHSLIIHASVGDEWVRFFAEPGTPVQYGEMVEFSTSFSSIYLFDKETGASLKKSASESRISYSSAKAAFEHPTTG